MEATEAPPPEAAPEGTEAAAGSSQDGAETPTIDETIGLPPKFVGCTLVEGCALAAWHPGVCSVWLCSRRERKKISTYEAAAAPPPRDLAKKAREQGLIGPLKLANQVKRGASTKAQTHGKNGKKRKVEPEEASGEPEPEAPVKPKRKREPLVYDGKRTGARSGTRSHGEPVWAPALDEAVIESTEPPVSAALDVGSDGRVGLRLGVRSKPVAKPTINKGVAALRDYLGRGKSDPFANDSCSSVAQEQLDVKRGDRVVLWGCVCKGQVAKGGVELVCRRCSLTFHTKCERLDYSAAELQRIVQMDAYLCTDCERLQRIDDGYDPAIGRFTWQCKHCTRIFEENEYHAAEKHGARCAAQLLKREWSCPCHGQLGSTKLMATECKECNRWFHASCKSQLRNSWNVSLKKRLLRDTCAACEGTWSKGGTADGEKKKEEKPIAARTVKSALLGSELSALTAVCEHDVPGTLMDGRVHVRESTLGPHSGYGLFAGVPIRRNEVITAYYGTPLYREQLEPDHDTSYILRLPNSGGVLVNGKSFADAIRANPANPAEDGRCYPVDGAPEWHRGAGAMANDPRDRKRNNAIINFVKPKSGATKAARELAPVLPVLMATRDVEVGEEIFWSYGSEKPFEHIRKQAQQQQQQSKGRKGDTCKLVWVPHDTT